LILAGIRVIAQGYLSRLNEFQRLVGENAKPKGVSTAFRDTGVSPVPVAQCEIETLVFTNS
jgi:hypothetical protein